MKRIELFNDSFQNFKGYQLPKAQLVIADIPYNLGNNAYASNPMWYEKGDNTNSKLLARKGWTELVKNMVWCRDGHILRVNKNGDRNQYRFVLDSRVKIETMEEL